MNHPQKVSIIIIASLWQLTGVIFLFLGLAPFFGNTQGSVLFGLLLAVLLGALKGWLVIRKSCQRILSNIARLADTRFNLILGWVVALGWKGFLLLALMIILGITLGNWLESINPLYRGYLRVAIAAALLSASLTLWRGLGHEAASSKQ